MQNQSNCVITFDTQLNRMKTALTQWILLILIHWIVIYPVDSARHLLNNRVLVED